MDSIFRSSVLSRTNQSQSKEEDLGFIDIRQLLYGLFTILQQNRLRRSSGPSLQFSGRSDQLNYNEETDFEEDVVRRKELDLQEQQNKILEDIREGIEQLSVKFDNVQFNNYGAQEENGFGIPDIDLPGRKRGPSLPDIAKGKSTKEVLGALLTARNLKIGGTAAAIAAAGYTGYTLNQDANNTRDGQLLQLEAARESGAITEEEYRKQYEQINIKQTENIGGAIGAGSGILAGAFMGAKAGGTLGTLVGGPVGSLVGGAAGGIIGAISGSSVGQNIGGAIGSAVGNVKSFFGLKQETIEEIERKTQLLKEKDPERYQSFTQDYVKTYNELVKEHQSELTTGKITESQLKTLATVRTYESNKHIFELMEQGKKLELFHDALTFSPVGSFIEGIRSLSDVETFKPAQMQPLIEPNFQTASTNRNITEPVSSTDAKIDQLSRTIASSMSMNNSVSQNMLPQGNDRIITQPFTSSIKNNERTVNGIISSYR